MGPRNLILQRSDAIEVYTKPKRGEGSLHPRPKGQGIRDPPHSRSNKLIKYPTVRFKLYTACVPPLLKLLNIKSFVETQQTPSGRLKTTMGLHAASIWGNPERLQLNAESTAVGILKTVEFCTDLPIFVDETSITDKIKELVYLEAVLKFKSILQLDNKYVLC